MKKTLDALLAVSISELECIPWSTKVHKKVEKFKHELNKFFENPDMINKIKQYPDPDDQLQILIDTFNPHIEKNNSAISQNSLQKLDLISQQTPLSEGETLIRILQFNTALYSSVGNSIKKTVSSYKQHLEEKISNHLGTDFDITLDSYSALPRVTQKLISRYKKIKELDDELASKQDLDSNDMIKAGDAVIHCTKSKPDWSERPFLQQLTDVLSLGMKPLYRAFTSKERGFSDELSKVAIQQSSEQPSQSGFKK